ncbi:MAG: sigma-70 family RNA polymerase sigma factor [Flavobacteriaceae bacterium]|nr:sigma-70 family RNA polymerase sigma factor [Flavobacteriaceae bacterium]
MQNESRLIQDLQNKDTQALSKLYDKYSGAIYGVIIRICRDEGLAENILQDTFLKVWQNSSQYDPAKGRFYTWVYRIARNNTLNELRKGNNLIQTTDLGVYEDEKEELPMDYEPLKGSIQKLVSHHRKAIELVYFNGLTHSEAHKVMEVPLGTFKSYVRQALKQLRENYEME